MALVSYIACESKGVMLFRPAEETVDVLAAMIARAGGLPLYRAIAWERRDADDEDDGGREVRGR